MITIELYKQCRDLLLRCDELESHEALVAVFNTGNLIHHRHHIRATLTKRERVHQLLDQLLLDSPSTAEPAFISFLTSLHDRYDEGDALHFDIGQLRAALVQALSFGTARDINIVVIAMTRKEAEELVDGSAFNHPTASNWDRQQFEALRSALQDHGITDLASYYNETRESWKLPEYDETHESWKSPETDCISIRHIILQTINQVNVHNEHIPHLPTVNPRLRSEEFFAESGSASFWRSLSEAGCVLVVDAISLFHPLVRSKLISSQLAGSERVAMLILSPISINAISANRLVDSAVRTQMQIAFERFAVELDRRYELGVCDIRLARRWLFSTIPDVAVIGQFAQPRPSSIQTMGSQGERYGIERAVIGPGGTS